jgi:hypothetical protein
VEEFTINRRVRDSDGKDPFVCEKRTKSVVPLASANKLSADLLTAVSALPKAVLDLIAKIHVRYLASGASGPKGAAQLIVVLELPTTGGSNIEMVETAIHFGDYDPKKNGVKYAKERLRCLVSIFEARARAQKGFAKKNEELQAAMESDFR